MTVVEKVKFEVVANNAKPDDTPAWQSSKSYSPDDRVLFEGKIYVCAVANTNKKPDVSINEWSEMGNPNPTKFIDKYINTQTKSGGGNLEITIDVKDGFVNSFAMFNVDASRITVYDQNNEIIAQKSMTVRDTVTNWWQYFYGGSFSFRNDAWYIGDIDYKGKIKFVLEPNDKGANLGHLIVGKKIFLGWTQAEFAVKNIDYSKIVENPWGGVYIREGQTAKYADVSITMKTSQLDFNRKVLARVGKPTLFVGHEKESGFESLTIFGFHDDLEIRSTGAEYSETKLSIKGVI